MKTTLLLVEKLFYALPTDKNCVLSPYSILKALLAIYHASKGTTLKEISDFLDYQNLTIPRNSNLNEANDIWIDNKLMVHDSFKKKLFQNRIATHLLDLSQNSKACQSINHHIANITNHKITKLLSVDDFNEHTRLVLTNALYFQQDWLYPFCEDDTQLEAFYNLHGQLSQVSTMKNTDYFAYGQNEKLQVLRMPYKNEDTSMLIVLPKNQQEFQSIQRQGVNNRLIDQWQKMVHLNENRQIHVELPKFNLNSTFDSLKEYFEMMGLPKTFGQNPDFSNMTDEQIAINKMVHKADIEVGETGTVATASTAVMMYLMGNDEPVHEERIVDFIVNRPFFFMIENLQDMEVLFFGQVVEI